MENKRDGLSRDDARALTDRILGLSRADHARVNVNAGTRSYTRMAINRLTSAGTSSDIDVRITSVFGKRVASVSTNELDDENLAAAVRRSEALARLAPEDPEYMPELGAQDYEPVDGYYDATAALDPDETAGAGAAAVRRSSRSGLVAAGFIDVEVGSEAVATSNGCFGYHRGTGVAYTSTIRTPDGTSSGWAGDEAADWRNIESDRVARVAAEKCEAWRGATELAPGTYTAVLEPTAVGMLMLRMMGAFDGRMADEGRSYFSDPDEGNRLGQELFDSRVTMVSDPTAPDAESAPFTGNGLPVRRQTWIENGVLRTLDYSRYWASQKGVEPIAGPTNLIMAGGDASVDDMISSTERGVLITRFWYIRGLNPRTISYTGLTRDGTFLIENGRISRPVKNFRFNQSLAELLQNVEMLGRPTRVASSENSSVGPPVVVPALKVAEFNLSSVSDAI